MLGRRMTAALVLAALVGGVGGVAAAVLVPPGDETIAPTDINDPLRLGIPLVSQGCSGDALLVLGGGDTAAALTAAVSSAPDEVRYLRTDESCDTTWVSEGEAPRYVAYLGPYDDEAEPCQIRMDGGHPRDSVVNLNSGTAEFVTCVCVLPESAAPVLTPPGSETASPTDPADASNVTWVSVMQKMLADADIRPRDDGPPVAVTGVYDAETVAAVRRLQESNNIFPADGTAAEVTWSALKDEACPTYSF